MGFVSWDVTIPGTTGQFDIANETGPNSSGDSTFPVTTPVRLGNLVLNVSFSDGSIRQFDSSTFTQNPFDGLSFESPSIPIGGQNPTPLQATLTGTFLTTSIAAFDGSQSTISPNFMARISNGGQPLADGDLAVIFATSEAGPVIPEPSTWALILFALICLLVFRFSNLHGKLWRFRDGQ